MNIRFSVALLTLYFGKWLRLLEFNASFFSFSVIRGGLFHLCYDDVCHILCGFSLTSKVVEQFCIEEFWHQLQ